MTTHTGDRLLKVKTSALLRATGATTFIEVKVLTRSKRSYRQQVPATDLDVFAVRLASDLSAVRIVAECKSGEKDVVDDLYKLAGVVSSQHVDQAMLVRTKIGAHVREVARGMPVWTADADEMTSLLKSWVPDLPKVLEVEQRYLEKTVQYGAEVGQRHPKETSILLHEHWTVEDGKAIVGIVRASGNVANTTVLDAPERGVLTLGLLGFGVRLLRFAGQVMRLYPSDPVLGTRIQMAGSARQLRERESLAQLISGALPAEQAGKITGEPEYTPELSELALRLFRAAPKAYRCAYILEVFARWVLEGNGNEQTGALEKSLRDEDPVAIKLAQDIALMLGKWAKVEVSPFQPLLNL